MRFRSILFLLTLCPVVTTAPVAEAEQWAPEVRTKQWAPEVRTEQWAPEVRTEQWAPEVRTEIREPADLPQPGGSQPQKSYSTDGKKLVWVNWQGQPYQAYILESKGDRHYVTYKGWPSSYDEWIGKKSVITEAQAKRMQAKQKKQSSGNGTAVNEAYKQLDRSRELSNRLNTETQQQYRDTERYYDDRRRYGY